MKKITLLIMLFVGTFFANAQVVAYGFSQSSGTYTEITGGTALGSETVDDQRFLDPAGPAGGTNLTGVGLPIGFNFVFNGAVYDRFGINANGWICLGQSALGANAVNMNSSSYYTSLSSTVTTVSDDLVARISVLGRDLQAQVGSTLRFEVSGTAPNQVLTIQWKNYRKYAGTGDSYNFQIKLYETTNNVQLVYGAFVNNTTTTFQVGLRGATAAIASNYAARASTTSWASTTGALTAAGDVTMTNTIIPANGLTFTWAPPACPGAVGLTTTGLTGSNATITWNQPSPVPSAGYEYVVSTTNTIPTAAGTVSATNVASLTSLPSNTTHYVFVRTSCGGSVYGNWVLMGTFKTLCNALTEFVETFDTTPTGAGNMPSCWDKAGTGNIYTTTGSVAPMSPANRLYMNVSTTTSAFALMPQVSNLQAETHRLKFKVYASATAQKIRIGYFTNPADLTTYVPVEIVDVPATAATATEFTVIPYSIPVGVARLVFSSVPGVASTLYVDDVKWEENSSCVEPSALNVLSITDATAQLSWVNGATETEWQIQYGSPGFSLGSGTILTGITANPYTLTGLTANTNYQYYVRSVCSTSSLSSWSGPYSFKTTCVAITTLPWTENFDALTAGTNIFPSCWGYVNTTSTWSISTTPVAFSGANSLRRTWSTDGWAFTPMINLTAGTSYRFSYYVRTNDAIVGYDNTVAVGNGQTVGAMTTTLLTQTGYQNPTWVKQNIEFTPTSTGAYSFGLHVVAPVSPNGENFDNFTVELSPTCPDQTGIVIGTATTTDATFSWNATTGAAGYEYAVTTSATPPTSGTATTNTFATVTSLTPQTLYYVHVRTMCGVGSYGNWGTISFITGYCIPSSTSSSTYVNSFSTTGGSANISNLATGYSTGGYNNASTQFVEGFATSSFTFNAAIIGGTAGFSIWVDWNNDLFFDNATEKVFNTTSYGNGPFTGTITIPAGTTIGNHRMRITTDYLASNPSLPCGSPTTAEFEDYTISVIAPPACSAPAPIASVIGATTATLSWPAVASAAVGYEYVLDNVATNPATAGTATTALTYTAPSLTPSTTYYFHIRSVCSVGTFSTWSTISFITACVAQDVPYSQDFESATIPNLPLCTSLQNVGTGNLWTVVNAPGNGFTTKALTYSYNLSNAANVWFYTNGVNLTAGTAYKISYDYGTSYGSFYTEKLKVAYGTSASDASMTNVLADYTAVVNEAPINDIVNFTPTTSGVYYFGFNAKSDANEDQLYVDNILVDLALANNSFNSTSISVYPNPVKDILNINYTENISKIQVYNLLGQEVLTKSVNNTQNQLDMSTLVQGAYLVKITSNDLVKTMKVIKQ